MTVSYGIAVVLLVGTVAMVTASPARMFFGPGVRRNTPSYDNVVTVDCSNREAVRYISKTHANFRCVYPQQQQGAPVCPPGKILDSRRGTCVTPREEPFNRFPAGLQSASLIVEDPNNCPPGKMFVPEIGICLNARKPTRVAPLESDNLIVERPRLEITAFSSDVQNPSDCKSNEIFNSELGICMSLNTGKIIKPLVVRNLVRQPLPPLEIQSFSSAVQGPSDCNRDEIYVSEISSCVSMKPKANLKSASLVRDHDVPFSNWNIVTPKDCKKGEVFVSELGICLPANPPREKKPISSASLVQDNAPAIPFEDKITCRPGEILVPEIGICMPVSPSKAPVAPASSSLVKEPVKMEITAFEKSKDSSDCPPGSFFVSEIGECVHP